MGGGGGGRCVLRAALLLISYVSEDAHGLKLIDEHHRNRNYVEQWNILLVCIMHMYM